MSTDQAQRSKLTHKQESFVSHYAITGNATQSYRDAGYTASTDLTANVEGSKLLRNPKVQTAIQQRKAELAQSQGDGPEAVITELWKLARAGDTSASRVSALGKLADIYGMTQGNARELPDALNSMLEAVARGLAAGSKQAAISEPKTIELPEPRTSHASDSDDV